MKYTFIFLGIIAAFFTIYSLTYKSEPDQIEATLEVLEQEEERNKGFARALLARTFHFPPDHGPHPEYPLEARSGFSGGRKVHARVTGEHVTVCLPASPAAHSRGVVQQYPA